MPPLDITDLEIAFDDLLHDVPPTDTKPTPTPVPFPAYNLDDEAQHLYSLKIPMSLWLRLKLHVGERGNKAKFVRQAIREKLGRNPNGEIS